MARRALLLLILAACAAPPQLEDPVLAPGAELRRLADGLGFVEGPVWLDDRELLVFSDTPRQKLMAWSETAGLQVFRASPHPNGNALDPRGRLLSCRHGSRDLVRTEADGSLSVLASHWQGRRLNSPNDLAVDRDGSIWFTDPPWGLPGQREGREIDWNGVYRWDPVTGAVELMLRDQVMPNGIAWSPDFRTLYLADTGGHPSYPDPARREAPATVTAYARQPDNSLQPRWQTPTRCDGMAIDALGRIYTSSRAGMVVLDPRDGAILTELPLPESPANCAFGGTDGRTLFITARTGLYALRTAVPGAGRD